MSKLRFNEIAYYRGYRDWYTLRPFNFGVHWDWCQPWAIGVNADIPTRVSLYEIYKFSTFSWNIIHLVDVETETHLDYDNFWTLSVKTQIHLDYDIFWTSRLRLRYFLDVSRLKLIETYSHWRCSNWDHSETMNFGGFFRNMKELSFSDWVDFLLVVQEVRVFSS